MSAPADKVHAEAFPLSCSSGCCSFSLLDEAAMFVFLKNINLLKEKIKTTITDWKLTV